MISAWCFFASAMTSSPAHTRVSLLARPIRLPALMAAKVGFKPTMPTTAVITQSACSNVAASMRPSSPQLTRVGRSRSCSCNSTAASCVAITAKSGQNSRHCCAMRSTLVPAVNAATFTGSLRMISRLCRPIEPVEPRILTQFTITYTATAMGSSVISASIRGPTNTMESKRSSTPPWPGIRLP